MHILLLSARSMLNTSAMVICIFDRSKSQPTEFDVILVNNMYLREILYVHYTACSQPLYYGDPERLEGWNPSWKGFHFTLAYVLRALHVG